jgi:hypothetical protein
MAASGESPAPTTGSGEQPDLPDSPLHWQQQTLTPVAAREATITIDSLSDNGDASSQPGGDATPIQASTEGPALSTGETPVEIAPTVETAEPVAAEISPATEAEPAAPRRRARREEGERAPRVRKPRRSRDETAPALAESAAVPTEETATTPPDSDMPAPAAPEYAAPAPAPAPSAAPADVAAAEVVSAPITVIEIPSSGDPAVTVLDKPSNESSEPKRRGWWRRLME